MPVTKQLFADVVDQIFSAMGDIPKQVDYYTGDAVYDPQAGTLSDEGDLVASFTAFLLNYKRREIDGTDIIPEDKKLVFKQKDLPQEPSVKDKVDIEGDTWEIQSVGEDPADATWVLQIRKP